MKLNTIILLSILLLAIVSLGAVNAQENLTSEIMGEQNLEDLNPVSEVSDDIIDDVQTPNIDDNKLTTSAESVVGEINSDNITVEVSNVFKGCETSISVTVPDATGTVNITVGEKSYTPEFIGSVATQVISEYKDGINNVTVKYNNVIKETGFKVLDGVITYETFYDYFEKVGVYNHEARLRSFIPDGITLDLRGNFYFKQNISYIIFDKPVNLISTTKDASIDVYQVHILGDEKSNVSNIEFKQNLFVASYNSVLNNLTINSLHPYAHNLIILNSIIINKIDNFNNNNVTIFNSILKDGLELTGTWAWEPACNLIIKNSIINGTIKIKKAKDCLFENNNITGNVIMDSYNTIFRNNIVHASKSTYAVVIHDTSDMLYNNQVVNNVLYSYKYCGNNAVYDSKRYYNLVENNTPTQIDININSNQSIVYDEKVILIINVSSEGNVIVDVDGQKHVLKIVNGMATLAIDKYVVGINNISVVYEDLINDIYAINHTSFNVSKVAYCPIKLVYDEVVEEKASTINVILPDDANGTIFLRLYDDDYSILIKQDAKGKNNFINVPPLLNGNYIVSAVFNSIKYVTNSTKGSISFVHIPVYKLTANDVTMDYNDGSKYNVIVTKDGKAIGEGEVVKITFNGKTSDVKTDKNGYATFTLDAAPKTYAINVAYKDITKSNKITIKNVLKASNVSKKKAKTIKFSATLKTSKGKAIVGKKITFKLKGKTYSAKTNKKGVATISIKNLKVGKYTITSKYGLCTVKNTIKIKK